MEHAPTQKNLEVDQFFTTGYQRDIIISNWCQTPKSSSLCNKPKRPDHRELDQPFLMIEQFKVIETRSKHLNSS